MKFLQSKTKKECEQKIFCSLMVDLYLINPWKVDMLIHNKHFEKSMMITFENKKVAFKPPINNNSKKKKKSKKKKNFVTIFLYAQKKWTQEEKFLFWNEESAHPRLIELAKKEEKWNSIKWTLLFLCAKKINNYLTPKSNFDYYCALSCCVITKPHLVYLIELGLLRKQHKP